MLLDLTKPNLGVDVALDVTRTDPKAHEFLTDRAAKVAPRLFAETPATPSAFGALGLPVWTADDQRTYTLDRIRAQNARVWGDEE